MKSKLQALRQANDMLQGAMSETSNGMVDAMLMEMDAARMGAVDREVVRRDMIGMVQEREQMGQTVGVELDDDMRLMCRQIVADTGYRHRLEYQLFAVFCLQLFFVVNDLFVVLSLLVSGGRPIAVNQGYGGATLLGLIWYYLIYKCYRRQCIFRKRARPIGAGVAVGLGLVGFILFVFCGQILNTLTAGLSVSAVAIYGCVILDIVLLWVVKRSYSRYIDEQCAQYNLA